MTKEVKELRNLDNIELIGFPFENPNKKVTRSDNPSLLMVDSTLITADDIGIRISDTDESEIFENIARIIGRNHFNDIRHIDTAYKENCKIFISPDKGDIISKAAELEKLTGIKFFYHKDIEGIKKAILG